MPFRGRALTQPRWVVGYGHVMRPPADAERTKRYVRRLAASFASCTTETSAYGACIRGHMEAVERGACETEFRALSKCFRAELAKRRGS